MPMNTNTAVALLESGRGLTTGMLEPLGISFEIWLRYAQLPEDEARRFEAIIISHYRELGVK